ncbi:family A G protein-coupled receptor-like protein [Artomyces pyxidatus]|uniref:Family A G protein-coupled receptor-like protein n=1 Tax=Artomyces pyxidatus TaxID=48021 RepID=A0ACB8T0M4_9AGAM|nr:family A G protein-coupled receptor-like protein [Artomyces pyxidatus]
MGNSLQSNPPTAQLHISVHATDWLWTVFAIMLVSTFYAIFRSMTQSRGQRAFHHIAVVILTTASIAYFSMASDLGQTAIRTEFSRNNPPGVTRNIFYVRYIQWFINAPLIVLMLLLATGLPLSEIFVTIFMTLVVVVTGLVGALTASSYKWGYWTMGVFALLYVFFSLLWSGTRSSFHANRQGYVTGTAYIAFLWLLYPLVWALCEGGNVIGPTGEMVWYGLLDLLSGPVFLFVCLAGLRNVEYGSLGLQSGKTSDYAGSGLAAGAGAGAAASTNSANRGVVHEGTEAHAGPSGIAVADREKGPAVPSAA